MSKFVAFAKDESGASAAEYAIILAIIGAALVTAMVGLRTAIVGAVGTTATEVSGAGTA